MDERGLPITVEDVADDDDLSGDREQESETPSLPHTRRVDDVLEIWRIDDEWWRIPICRRYVEVVLEGGRHVVLFEDVDTGTWYEQKP